MNLMKDCKKKTIHSLDYYKKHNKHYENRNKFIIVLLLCFIFLGIISIFLL